jgi:hypothetical protein
VEEGERDGFIDFTFETTHIPNGPWAGEDGRDQKRKENSLAGSIQLSGPGPAGSRDLAPVASDVKKSGTQKGGAVQLGRRRTPQSHEVEHGEDQGRSSDAVVN